jgi:4-hydroxy-tetrahydrodipicolinate reductase
MTDLIIFGCGGAMGQTIARLVKNDPEYRIVAGVDMAADVEADYPVFGSLTECDVKADAVIDFSHVSAMDALMDGCAAKGLPLVLCTTGLTKEHLEKAARLSEKVPVLRSANMSLGINLLQDVLKQVSQTLSDAGFDIEIVEKHHHFKHDAPSGTALALADAVNEGLDEPCEYVYDRTQRLMKRPQKEIGISAVRGGTIVGTHEVIFAGEDEVITFEHMSYSKAVFAKGALSAAAFLKDQKPGMYDMGDVIRAAKAQDGN